jgi:hypothetical protein
VVTRLALESLEERSQPGSLFTSGIDVLPASDPLNLHKTRPLRHARAIQYKNPSNAEVDAEVVAVVNDATAGSAPRVAPRSLTRQSSDNSLRAASNRLNPNFFVPSAVTIPQRYSEPLTRTSVSGTTRAINLPQGSSNLLVERHNCDNSGTKALLYRTYEGTSSDDAVLAVATGKDGFIGEAYSAGFSGPFATVKNYDTSGGCGPLLTIGDFAGSSLQARDIAVNPNGVYAVGTNDSESFAFIARLNAETLEIIGTPVILSAPAGGTISLNGVGLRQDPLNADVFATGHVFDPSGPGYSTTLVASFSTNLAPLFSVAVEFVDASRGLSIDVDRAGNAYVGDRFAAEGVPMTFRLNAGGGQVSWAFLLESGTTFADPDNGIHDVKLLGGASAAGGVYTVGSLADSPFDSMLVAKWDPISGDLEYAWLWIVSGVDLSGQGNDVDRNGDIYVAAYSGSSPDRDAFLVKIDETGGNLDYFTNLASAGFDDSANDVALVTRSGDSDVVMAGSTKSPELPGGSGCQPAYNGALDGFVAKWSQPF